MASSSTPREPLVPTINFSMVCPGVYRSGYPTKKNYSFLCALRLRSILYLCPEDYAESNLKFCEENGIHVLRFPTEGNKEPFNDISEPLMHRILGAICDTRNLPLLIHCNKGKHRTGTVVSCLRHLQGWSLVSIFEEYKRFASDKARVGDQQYVELYHPIVKLTPPFVAAWVTITPRVTLVTSDRELMEAETIQLGTSLLAPDKPEKAAKKAKAATAVPATAVAAATTGAMPSTSPIMQSAPPTTAAPPPLPPAALSSSAASGAGGAAGALPHVLSSVSGSLPPTSPPPSGAKQQQQQQQLLDVPISTHAISSNGTAANAAGPSISAGTGAGTAVPTATTTTTTNVKTNTTAAAGDGASGGGVASPAAGSAGNGSAPGSSGHHSSGSVGKGMSTSASWHSPTSAPPSAVFTTVPQSSTSAHSGGGANGSTGSANSQSSIPPLDKEMRL